MGLFGLLGAVAVLGTAAAATAEADAPPPYVGAVEFPEIHGPADPEEYSFTVTLGEEQVLREVDDRHAAVYYSGHMVAFVIEAEPAHDADGTAVPTTLAVTGPNVITLTVHHRAGNPAAEGAPFDYPVVAGLGWEGGFTTTIVQGPPDQAQNQRNVTQSQLPPRCLVPKLKGRNLAILRSALASAHCALGKVHHRDAAGQTIVRQGTPPGTDLPAGSRVWVTVGSR